jgi:molecular chaperone GrpE
MTHSDPLQPEPETPDPEMTDSSMTESGGAESGGAREAEAPAIDAAQARVAGLEAEVAALKDQALRAMAEAENTRKRALKERDDARKFAITDFARDLVGFADNFHRAIDAIPKEVAAADERVASIMTGLEAMEREIIAMLERHGVRKIRPMDEPFNPHFHEVMFEADGTGKPPGTVVQVIEAGYVLNDRLLRPARVGVAKGEAHGGRVDESA